MSYSWCSSRDRAALTGCLVALFLAVFAASGRAWLTNERVVPPSERATVPVATAPQTETLSFTLNRAQLGHHVVRALDALGDRFESPGRARSILTGAFVRHVGGTQVSAPMVLLREFPDKVRFEVQTASGLRVLGHDGRQSWSQDSSISREDAALVEELVTDSVEHFITGQATGDATFHLGDMFRLNDSSDAEYAGPFYDILRVDDTFRNSSGLRARPTLFYLNSRTGLPERIVYELPGEGATTRVEVEFGEWFTVAGQKLPRRTAWKKGGALVGELIVNQAVFSPSANDGIFISPSGR